MRQYLAIGFNSKVETEARSTAIAEAKGCDISSTKYWFQIVEFQKDEYGLLVPEDQLDLLNEDEKTGSRLIEISRKPFMKFRPPEIYRVIENEFIDEFFDKGKIQLSCFSEFARHKDEARRDGEEGQNILRGEGKEFYTFAKVSHGHNAYVLSFSVLESHAKDTANEGKGYFVVKNPNGFMNAIARKLIEHRDFQGVLQGFCLYRSKRVIDRPISLNSIDDFKNHPNDDTLSMDKVFALNQDIGGDDVFFLKKDTYAHEAEYRILWFVEGTVTEAIKLECPEAALFCQRT